MHQPIRDNLENYLNGSAQGMPQEFQAHLAACEDCVIELRVLEAQARMLRSLRPEKEADPRPGFYARVMERIERQGPRSIWSILLEPNFGRRIAIASATLALLLGTYLVTSESSEPEFAATHEVEFQATPASSQAAPAEQDSLQQQRQRDAVLVSLASYHE